jgi:hypothetical protein
MPETPNQLHEQNEPLDAETLAIRTLNDQLRKTFSGGQVLLTPGVNALKAETLERVLHAVRDFDDFTPDNDPYRTHDFGMVDIDGERVMFKVDAYDKNHEYGSPDPADPSVTARVLTILLASEYQPFTPSPMGLDQYAFTPDRSENPEFIWRKHAKLQTYMEELYYARAGKSAESFNCVDLALTANDIAALEALIASDDLPDSEGGFFFGHQWQDESAEEYKEQDLKFCKWAAAVLETRQQVIYSCWW